MKVSNDAEEFRAERPDNPRDVLNQPDMTLDDKIAFLKDWQLDLMERLKATEENMSGTNDESRLAEQLRQVTGTLRILED